MKSGHSPKTALVSGSSRGIGRGIASVLCREGYRVFVNGRSREEVEKTCRELGPLAIPLVGDFVESGSMKQILSRFDKGEDLPDLVVANIGSGRSQPGWEVPEEETRRLFEINFFSAANLCQWSFSRMKNRGGHFVAIASIAGHETLGAPVAYAAAKAGLLAYVKNISRPAAALGIRVNAVSPGNVMFEGGTWDVKIRENREKVENYLKNQVPLNAFAKPVDIGEAVLYLEKNPFITGTALVVDGGQTVSF